MTSQSNNERNLRKRTKKMIGKEDIEETRTMNVESPFDFTSMTSHECTNAQEVTLVLQFNNILTPSKILRNFSQIEHLFLIMKYLQKAKG